MTTPCARCDWRPLVSEVPADVQAADHARAAGHPRCMCCLRSLDEHDPVFACERCLSLTQRLLAEITSMHADLPALLGGPSAAAWGGGRGSGDAVLPGGDALVLLAGGSDAPHDKDSRDGDAISVQWALLTWAQDWSEMRNDGVYEVSG